MRGSNYQNAVQPEKNLDSALLNLSIKDIKTVLQENKILRQSLRESKIREASILSSSHPRKETEHEAHLKRLKNDIKRRILNQGRLGLF